MNHYLHFFFFAVRNRTMKISTVRDEVDPGPTLIIKAKLYFIPMRNGKKFKYCGQFLFTLFLSYVKDFVINTCLFTNTFAVQPPFEISKTNHNSTFSTVNAPSQIYSNVCHDSSTVRLRNSSYVSLIDAQVY
jgi:hypothetical protein